MHGDAWALHSVNIRTTSGILSQDLLKYYLDLEITAFTCVQSEEAYAIWVTHSVWLKGKIKVSNK